MSGAGWVGGGDDAAASAYVGCGVVARLRRVGVWGLRGRLRWGACVQWGRRVLYARGGGSSGRSLLLRVFFL